MKDSRATRPASERTCVCGHISGSRSWYTRHTRTCEKYQALTLPQLARHTMRAHMGRVVANIERSSPLLDALMKNSA